MGYLREGDPARYHLATTPNGIDVAVHKQAIVKPTDINRNLVDNLARNFGVPHSFTFPSPDREWGFGPVLTQVDSPNPDWVLYSCDLPQGKPGGINRKSIATSATLSVLFGALEQEGKETDSPIQQHQIIDAMHVSLGDSEGFGLIVHLNPPLIQWLTENMSEPVSETVVEAMMKSYHRMWKTRPSPFDRHQFYVNWQEPGLLFTRVPMATLNSDRDGFKLGRGYDMSTNNSDLPHQQLSLLVGLAKIEELATGAYFRKVPQAI